MCLLRRFPLFLLSILALALAAPTSAQSVTTFGYSRYGQPIEVETYGTGPIQVLIIGGQHGDEFPSVPLVTKLRDEVRDNPGVIDGRTVHFLLRANPDGVDLGTRQNAFGVDLNRNMKYGWLPSAPGSWTYGGPSPYSEPESQALDLIIQTLQPQRILSVHAYANILDYDTSGGHILAQLMAKKNGMLVTTIAYPTPGSLGHYCRYFNIPLVTLELPPAVGPTAMWNAQRAALLTFIQANL